MIKQALKKGQFVKNDKNGKTYQIVDFTELVYLVELDAIANGLEALTAADFWKVSGNYLKNNFSAID